MAGWPHMMKIAKYHLGIDSLSYPGCNEDAVSSDCKSSIAGKCCRGRNTEHSLRHPGASGVVLPHLSYHYPAAASVPAQRSPSAVVAITQAQQPFVCSTLIRSVASCSKSGTYHIFCIDNLLCTVNK